MSTRDRLNRSQIIVLRELVKRDLKARGITLPQWMIKPSIPLWRSGLIEIWYRQHLLTGRSFGSLNSARSLR